jgi:hypothetical protein
VLGEEDHHHRSKRHLLAQKPKVMMNAAADVPVLRGVSSPFFFSQTLLLISLLERLVETCEF